MQVAAQLPRFSFSVPPRKLVLLAMMTIGISIQLLVPDGTTVTGIDVHGQSAAGQSLSLPHSSTVTGTTAPNSITAVTAPRSATAVSTPQASTATAPRSQTVW